MMHSTTILLCLVLLKYGNMTKSPAMLDVDGGEACTIEHVHADRAAICRAVAEHAVAAAGSWPSSAFIKMGAPQRCLKTGVLPPLALSRAPAHRIFVRTHSLAHVVAAIERSSARR